MDRVLTIPNAISAARLAGVPVFLWLVLGPRTPTADYWAVALLIVAGASDWLDGKLARALNQGSRLGEVLDPIADRLYIAATIIALAVRQIIPWWLVAILALRELVVGVARGVQQVEDRVVVVEAQRRRGDRDAPGALHRHPVRGHAPAPGLAVHRARLGDRRRVQGQGLGERRLARVRVADDGERPPPLCLAKY